MYLKFHVVVQCPLNLHFTLKQLFLHIFKIVFELDIVLP